MVAAPIVDPDTGEVQARTPDQVLALLQRPFPPASIATRTIKGARIHYVPIDRVIDRLNRAAPTWHTRIGAHWIDVLPVMRKEGIRQVPCYHVTLALEIPGLGSREAIGVAVCEGSEDAGKSAASDALKRAASLFGVPLDGGQ